jgi:syntaxin 16
MESIINQRKEDISNIANIMNDINCIAKDLAVETQEQGEKLGRLDENMVNADRNASEALVELTQAQVYQKKSGKCMYFLVSVIVLCLIIMGIFLATSS